MIKDFEYEIPYEEEDEDSLALNLPIFADSDGNPLLSRERKKYFSHREINSILNVMGGIRSEEEFLPLTQKEIDQLLNAINTKKTKKCIRDYDFSKVRFLTREQEESVKLALEDFRKFLLSNMACLFRKFVYFHIAKIEQMSYESMLRSIANPKGVFEFKGKREQYILMMPPPSFSYELMDSEFRRKGRKNSLKEAGYENFYKSCHKQNLWFLKKLLAREVLPLFNKLFLKPTGQKFRLSRTESNLKKTRYSPILKKGILITLDCKIVKHKSLFTIWFPQEVLDGKKNCFIPKDERKENFRSAKKMEENAAKKIDDVQVNVKVVLGQTALSLKEIKCLKKGMVLELDRKIYSGAEIEVNGAKIAESDVVSVDGKFGVKVTEMYKTNKQKRRG